MNTKLSQPPFTPTPYPYQIQGAIQATYHNKTLIADEPGLGKTLQALLTARIIQAKRVIIICPPILTTNWKAETARTGNTETIITLDATTKTHNLNNLPDQAYLIIPDSLLTARPQYLETLEAWRPELTIFDEAHRYKNPYAKRTKNALHLAKHSNKTLCLTGTPITKTPADLYTLLKILGKTKHFQYPFLSTYCTKDYFGNWKPKKDKLDELKQTLDTHVWTRHTKKEVLTQLPAKTRTQIYCEPEDPTLINKEITQLLEPTLNLDKTQLEQWAKDTVTKLASLRRITGLAKTELATSLALEHYNAYPGEPLIIWAIHKTVIHQLANQIQKQNHKLRLAVINGQTTQKDRDQIVQFFQAGRLDLLIAQIHAAGVGLTLTKATRAIFLETDWTVASVAQAEDRIHRLTQNKPVRIETIIAKNTLDPYIHKILTQTISVLDKLNPGMDHKVSQDNLAASSSVTSLLIDIALGYRAAKQKRDNDNLHVNVHEDSPETDALFDWDKLN